jgi:exopolyphosphatase/guanosine-5'-triphosphate,3'-diphosphate pyrophosphatase
MKAYGVRSYIAYATSAMREADNKDEVLKRLLDKTGIHIETIDGEREAELILSTFYTQKLPDHPYIFIDVGGGSTELSVIIEGEKKGSKSFKIGTVRELSGKSKDGEWERMEQWLEDKKIIQRPFAAIGTGGNINRVAKLHEKKYLEAISIDEIKSSLKEIEGMSYEDRIQQLRLKPDRADVIVPALNIYERIMRLANIQLIFVPKMGLADGMVLEQHFKHIDNHVFF